MVEIWNGTHTLVGSAVTGRVRPGEPFVIIDGTIVAMAHGRRALGTAPDTAPSVPGPVYALTAPGRHIRPEPTFTDVWAGNRDTDKAWR